MVLWVVGIFLPAQSGSNVLFEWTVNQIVPFSIALVILID